ncbi:fasciclin domain-containing protein [Pedobacter sp. B4-66]|uniref:fasciclin domain-containing protein n=1 Tax=Pedobacter sp. B4-66 TaxID=2817280 RepID=UPI001BD98A8F|nr:fasciclin domain-containing protein [Pedobacter sp. B4-66]
MKNIIKRYFKPAAILTVLLITVISSCKKDEYYNDGGKANPVFNGNVMQYLESNDKFDTIAQIVKLAGMEDVFKNENITFFAPTDEVIRRTIGLVNTDVPNMRNMLNQELFDIGKDTIKTLSDVQPQIWKRFLSRYIYKGTHKLKDYPQIDFKLRELFPGSFYYTYDGEISNIGVVFNEVNGVKYVGYRQLALSYLSDPSAPSDPRSLITAAVATSDIQPSNGVVHVLAISLGNDIGELPAQLSANVFGFNREFMIEVILSK